MVPVGVLEILRGTLCKVYDCLTTQLYTPNQYKIKLEKKANTGKNKIKKMQGVQPREYFSHLALCQ